MMQRLRHILEMIRFSHTVFALPFALLAAVMAWTVPVAQDHLPSATRDSTVLFRWQDLIGIVLCMVAARSAAMAFNRLADVKIDANNPRTAGRHLPAGILSTANVIIFTFGCSIAFITATLLFLPNRLPVYLSVPVLVFLFLYSYTKRFTALAHFWLGAALMLAPVCAWIAIRGELLTTNPLDILPAVMLGLVVLLWVAGFDIIYACQDVDFDHEARLHSIPARWGVVGALRLAAVCHLGMIGVLTALPFVHTLSGSLGLGWIYWTGVGATTGLLFYEHWIVRPDDLARVNIAFFHVNSIVSIGLFIVGTVDLCLG